MELFEPSIHLTIHKTKANYLDSFLAVIFSPLTRLSSPPVRNVETAWNATCMLVKVVIHTSLICMFPGTRCRDFHREACSLAFKNMDLKINLSHRHEAWSYPLILTQSGFSAPLPVLLGPVWRVVPKHSLHWVLTMGLRRFSSQCRARASEIEFFQTLHCKTEVCFYLFLHKVTTGENRQNRSACGGQ